MQDLSARHPGSWQARLELGRLLVEQRRLQEAIPHLEEAARLAPAEFEARSALGQAFALSDRLPDAEREFRAAAGLRPRDPLSRFNLGRIYRLQERYPEALLELEAALERETDPQRLPMMHQNLAAVLVALQRPSQALPHLEAYVKARPEQLDMRYQIASLNFDVGAYDASLAQVEKVLERAPRRDDALNLRGMLLKIKGRNEEAIASFRAAVAARPDLHRARYQMATVLCDEGRYAEAEEPLRAVLAAEPEHPNAHYLLSTVLRRLRREREAEEELSLHRRISEEQRARGRTMEAGPQ